MDTPAFLYGAQKEEIYYRHIKSVVIREAPIRIQGASHWSESAAAYFPY